MNPRRSLTPAAVAEVDVSNQMRDALNLPEQLRDAIWRVNSAALSLKDSPGGLVVAGVGGLQHGGSLARAALGDRASRAIKLARGYELPAWTTPDTTVLCVSYTGDTEETLAIYEASRALGAQTVALTTGGKLAEQARADGVPVIPLPGGFQPRAAIAYALVATLEVAALCGVGQGTRSEIDVASVHAQKLVEIWRPEGPEDSLPKSLARALLGTIPQIAGAQLTAPVAYRWKTQLNENAKVPAFAAELPELDYNELVGWERAQQLGRFVAVFLDDSDLHPRVRQRIELTRGLIASRGATTLRVDSIGETRLERIVSLILLGDLVSLYLAALEGIDPAPVEVVDSLKAALAGG